MPIDVDTTSRSSARFPTRSLPVSGRELLCRWLRGAPCAWPANGDADSGRALVELCVGEGVAGLIYSRCCGEAEWSSWPLEVREGFARHARMSTAMEMARTLSLREVIDALARAGIESLLLKGAALAYTHYESPGLRVGSDEDLFISARDVRAALGVLSDLGYSIRGTLYASHQFGAVKQGIGGVTSYLDIHWRISNSPRYARFLGFEEASERSIPIAEVSRVARGLGVVDALMLACVHRAANPDHDRDRLIWLFDIHLLVESLDGSQRSEFVALASGRRTAAVCLEGISLSQSWFGTTIPESFMAQLAAAAAEESTDRRYADSYLSLVLDDLRALPDSGQRLRLLRELAFPPIETMQARFGVSNPVLIGILYFWRGLRGGCKRLVGR